MAKTFREGMPMPTNPDDMTAKKKVKKPAPRTKLPALKPGEYDAPMEPDMGSVGMKCGGKVKKMAAGGGVRGGGIAQRGVGKGRMC